jgi:hypothetical protein
MSLTSEIRNECVKLVEEYFRIHRGEDPSGVGYMADDGEMIVIIEAHTAINDHVSYRVEVNCQTYQVLRLFKLVANDVW